MTDVKNIDHAAVAGWVLWLTAHALEWIPVLQALSLLLASLAAAASLLGHFVKWWHEHKRKEK